MYKYNKLVNTVLFNERSKLEFDGKLLKTLRIANNLG